MIRQTALFVAGALVAASVISACVTVGPASPQIGIPSAAPTTAIPTTTSRTTAPTLPVLTGAPPSGAATTSLTPSTAPATATPPSAATTITVVLDSGPDAGTYLATADPQCSVGVIGEDTWSAQYGNFVAGPTDLSTVQLTDEPDSSDSSGKSRIFSAYVIVGLVVGGMSYTLSLDRFSAGKFVDDIQDNGATAVIHAAGKSVQTPLGQGGIGVDLTVNCPTVNRQ